MRYTSSINLEKPQLSGYKVRDLIIDDKFTTIHSSATVYEATKKMKEAGVPDLVILDNENQKVIGVISENNIIQDIIAEGKDPQVETVVNAMFKIEPVKLDTPIEIAFVRMRNLKVAVIPVVRKGNVIGICTIHDCWSYLPQEKGKEPLIGLIPVSNPNAAKCWLASICAILAFILGVVFPLMGIFGYFSAEGSQLTGLLQMVTVRGDILTFFLFEVHGTQLSINYSDLISAGGVTWIFLIIFGFAVLITGVVGIFSLFYASYSILKNQIVGKFHQKMSPFLTIIFLVMEWVLLAVVLANNTPEIAFQIDETGLVCSVSAIILILLAIYRDHLFTLDIGVGGGVTSVE